MTTSTYAVVPAVPLFICTSVTQLKSIPTTALTSGCEGRVGTSTSTQFRWDPADTDADDGVNTLKASDNISNAPGRWRIGVTLASSGVMLSSPLDMGSHKITGLANPTANSQEAATANFVASLIAGLGVPVTFTAQTVDITPVLGISIPIPDNSTTTINFQIVGRNPDTFRVFRSNLIVTCRRHGGGSVDVGELVHVIADFTGSLPSAPEDVTGSADITVGGIFGIGGSLDGKNLNISDGSGFQLLTLSGAGNAVNSGALFSAINTKWPTITASLSGVNILLQNVSTGSSHAINIGATTANGILGLSAGANLGYDAPGGLTGTPGATNLDCYFVGTHTDTWNWIGVYTDLSVT